MPDYIKDGVLYMPFGKYSGKAITTLPASYLLYIYKKLYKGVRVTGYNRPVYNYILDNYDKLLKQYKDETGKEWS